MAEHYLDVTGLSCPFPILKAQKMLLTIPPGETLEILSTDPNAFIEFQAFCESSGHELLDMATIEAEIYRFVIKRAHEMHTNAPLSRGTLLKQPLHSPNYECSQKNLPR